MIILRSFENRAKNYITLASSIAVSVKQRVWCPSVHLSVLYNVILKK